MTDSSSGRWDGMAEKAIAGTALSRDEALAVLGAPEDELLAVLHAAFRVRRRFHGRGVRLHVLRNAKSGMCRENCAFCSQALGADAGVDPYRIQTVDELLDGARRAHAMKAAKYCIVTATRGPSERELDVICEAVRRIKAELPLRICTSLGLLRPGQAERLAAAGVNRFNHNLETSARFFPTICQTHSYADRIETLRRVKAAGMEACCGGIMGMGETLEDRVDLAFAVRELQVESIPVNFLDPRPGTPLEHQPRLTPAECLKALCLFRLTNPSSDIRAAGGREANLRHLQALALYPANSIFTEGYLTTDGQGYDRDLALIADAGFHVAEIVEEAD